MPARAEEFFIGPADWQAVRVFVFGLTYIHDLKIVMQTRENLITDWWSTRPKPAWANVWHLWTVFLPRRTITGRLVCGKVWRRHDGRRWIYKRFVQFNDIDL